MRYIYNSLKPTKIGPKLYVCCKLRRLSL